MMIEVLAIAMVMIGEEAIATGIVAGEVIAMVTESHMIAGTVAMVADMETEIRVETMAEVATVTETGEGLIVPSLGGMETDQNHPILSPLGMTRMALQGIHSVIMTE